MQLAKAGAGAHHATLHDEVRLAPVATLHCCVVLCCAALCCVMLYCVVLCCAVPVQPALSVAGKHGLSLRASYVPLLLQFLCFDYHYFC